MKRIAWVLVLVAMTGAGCSGGGRGSSDTTQMADSMADTTHQMMDTTKVTPDTTKRP